MTWTFLWLLLLLKIPIAGMLWIVWWAIHKADKEEPTVTSDEDGGSKLRLRAHREPRRPRPYSPRHPRRGPHAGLPPAAPRRTRSVVALGRRLERHAP
jgi:hypothetical protein